MNGDQDLIPVEQQTLTFYGKALVIVRLPNGQPGVVLRFLCEEGKAPTAPHLDALTRRTVLQSGASDSTADDHALIVL